MVEVLFARIVLTVAVSTSLSRIMLGSRALVSVVNYVLVMRKGFHSVSWEMLQGQRLGGGHISDQAARRGASEQLRRSRSRSDMPEANSCKVDGSIRTTLWQFEHGTATSLVSATCRREVELDSVQISALSEQAESQDDWMMALASQPVVLAARRIRPW